MNIRIGILFGGSSKQREKSLLAAQFLALHLPTFSFEKMLIWISTDGKMYSVKQTCFLKGDVLGNLIQEIETQELGHHINIALSTLAADDIHGPKIQEVLENLNIPSNMNTQSRDYALDLENWWTSLKTSNFRSPVSKKVMLSEWDQSSLEEFTEEIKKELGELLQIIPMPYSAKRGGSFILPGTKNDMIQERINRAFFRDWISKSDWKNMPDFEKKSWIEWLADPLEGPDFPLKMVASPTQKNLVSNADELIAQLDILAASDTPDDSILGIEPIAENPFVQLVSVPVGTPFQSLLWFHDDHWQCLPPFTDKDNFFQGKIPSAPLSEIQVKEISSLLIELGQHFLFDSPQIISGIVTPSGKIYPIEIQPFLEDVGEKKWFNHLGLIDASPSHFLEIIINQILSFQELQMGISGKIANQLSQILKDNQASNSPTYLNAVILDSFEFVSLKYLKEAVLWYEKLSANSSSETILIFTENSTLGLMLYEVPVRWLYLSIYDHLEINDLFAKIRKHCQQVSIQDVKEKGYTLIPITANKNAATGNLFQWLEKEKLPYWGLSAAYSSVNFKKNVQLETLKKNGFKTYESWKLPEWLLLNGSDDHEYFITSNDLDFQAFEIEIKGVHEMNAFKQFLKKPPKLNETLRNRKIWQQFFDETNDAARNNAFLLKQSFNEEFIISFYYSKEGANSYQRCYLTPVLYLKMEDQQVFPFYLKEDHPKMTEIQSIWIHLTDHLEGALHLLGFNCPGFIRFSVTIFEDKSFQLFFREISPLFSLNNPWLENQILANEVFWHKIIWDQNEFAKKKLSFETEEEKVVIILIEEKKLPFQHIKSDIEEKKGIEMDEEREKRINEAMNNLTPTRFSKNYKQYAAEIWPFLKSWFFIKNLLAYVISFFVLINLIKGILFLYTRHGSEREVLDYSGIRLESAIEKAQDQGFKLVASDEVYVLNRPSGIIISHVPAKGSKIKSGRTIYCVVTGGAAPAVILPKLSNNDEYEAYQKQLIRIGIFSRIREERFEAEYEEKTILEVYFEGKKLSNRQINAGIVKIPKGSYLDFVISVRNTDRTPVPDLICKTYEEAVTNIIANDLKVGTIIGPEENQSFSGMYIWKQEPMAGEGVLWPKGSPVILYLQPERPAQCLEN